MKRRGLHLGLIAFACLEVAGAVVAAQQPEGQGFDPEAWQQAWEAFAGPTSQHDGFKEIVGEWKTVAKETWPGMQKPVVNEGEAAFRLLMGGRFLEQKYETKYGDKAFRSLGIHGYDKSKRKYVSIWIDNTSTGIMVLEGEWKEDQQAVVQNGECGTPAGKMRVRLVTKRLDKNKIVQTFYTLMPGAEEQQSVEIVYSR